MFLTLINFELWTTIYLFEPAVVALLNNYLPSFPNLIQSSSWAQLVCVSTDTPTHIISVSTDTPTHIISVSTNTAFIHWSPPISLLHTLTTDMKTTQNCLYVGNGESAFEHFLAMWPNLLHLLHIMGDQLAAEGDLFFTERIALSSSIKMSIVWDRRMDSPLIQTIVWICSLYSPCIKQVFPRWLLGLSLLIFPQVYKPNWQLPLGLFAFQLSCFTKKLHSHNCLVWH
jgi:hypothetical protein